MTGTKTTVLLLLLLLLLLVLCLAACTPREKETEAGTSFIKIYDKPDAAGYTAVDIRQNPEGDYIILGMKNSRPYLLKVDCRGDFIWDTEAVAFGNYAEPVAGLITLGRDHYFFCLHTGRSKFPISLLRFDEDQPAVEEIEIHMEEILFQERDIIRVIPLHASPAPDGDILLLAASDLLAHEIFLVKLAADGRKENGEIFRNIYDCYVAYPLTERRYHFTGRVKGNGNTAYFQTYASHPAYPSAMPCFRTGSLSPQGTLSGDAFPLQKPFIALLWHGGEAGKFRFSGARIDNSIVSFFVNSPLEGADQQAGDPRLELDESKAVFMQRMTINQVDILFFTGSSNSNEVVLYAYSLEQGKYLNSRYFGGIRLYQAAGFIQTNDGGLAILASTHAAGLYSRIGVFKLSPAELVDLVR